MRIGVTVPLAAASAGPRSGSGRTPSPVDAAKAGEVRSANCFPSRTRCVEEVALEKITLLAPLSGVMLAIDEVPDPVFATRMVGDGVSLDPQSTTLLAPFAGTVTQIHAALHALTLTHASGLEVIIHIGLDTVKIGRAHV